MVNKISNIDNTQKQISEILQKEYLNKNLNEIDNTINDPNPNYKINDLTDNLKLLLISIDDYKKLINKINNTKISIDDNKKIKINKGPDLDYTVLEHYQNLFAEYINVRTLLYNHICSFCYINKLNVLIEVADRKLDDLKRLFSWDFLINDDRDSVYKKQNIYYVTYKYEDNDNVEKFIHRNILIRNIFEGRLLSINIFSKLDQNQNIIKSYTDILESKNIFYEYLDFNIDIDITKKHINIKDTLKHIDKTKLNKSFNFDSLESNLFKNLQEYFYYFNIDGRITEFHRELNEDPKFNNSSVIKILNNNIRGIEKDKDSILSKPENINKIFYTNTLDNEEAIISINSRDIIRDINNIVITDVNENTIKVNGKTRRYKKIEDDINIDPNKLHVYYEQGFYEMEGLHEYLFKYKKNLLFLLNKYLFHNWDYKELTKENINIESDMNTMNYIEFHIGDKHFYNGYDYLNESKQLPYVNLDQGIKGLLLNDSINIYGKESDKEKKKYMY